MTKVENKIQQLIKELPPVDYVIGYGSGIYKQNGYDKNDNPDLDIIVSVDDFNTWHKCNMLMNPEQYSTISKSVLKQKTQPNSFFKNLSSTKFNYDDTGIKMMVVSTEILLRDLKTWGHFTLAGRLQKPIEVFKSSSELEEEIIINRGNAVLATLLMDVRDWIPENEFYQEIVSLSYSNDIRKIANCENKNKEKNIVDGALEFFKTIYGDNIQNGHIANYNPRALVDSLPQNLLDYIKIYQHNNGEKRLSRAELSFILSKYFKKVNIANSILLAQRCFLTVGPVKSVSHVLAKKKKNIHSK